MESVLLIHVFDQERALRFYECHIRSFLWGKHRRLSVWFSVVSPTLGSKGPAEMPLMEARLQISEDPGVSRGEVRDRSENARLLICPHSAGTRTFHITKVESELDLLTRACGGLCNGPDEWRRLEGEK